MRRDVAPIRWSYALLDFLLLPLLKRLGISPAAFSLAGLVLSAVAGLSYLISPVLAGCLALAGGLCDFFDGYWARASNRESLRGAFLDSVLDRYGESFLLVGVWAYLARDHGYVLLGGLLVLAALIGSFMVSYTRARGEGLSATFKGGVCLREERLLILVIGSLADPLAPGLVLLATVGLLALGANLTALYRLRNIYRQLEGPKNANLAVSQTTPAGADGQQTEGV